MGDQGDRGGSGGDDIRDRLIGLGTGSIRKSYYPELRRRLEDLDRMHAYLASVLDAMPSAILGVDADLRVTRANKAAGELAGCPASELAGRLFGDVFSELRRYVSGAVGAVREGRAMERRGAEVYEGRATRYFDIMLSPVEAGVSAVIRLDDVTDRIRLDRVIVQTEKMVSLGGLAAGMAHEINNPLGGILQGAQNIRLRLLEDRPVNREAARELGVALESVVAYAERRGIARFLEGIRDSGQRAAAIVQHMLEFSREADRQRTRERLEQVVDASLELAASDFSLERATDFRRIRIERDYQPGMPEVAVVRTEIEQVVFNCVKNAAEAMGAAGTPEPRLELSTRLEGPHAVIEIGDNGPGMDEETRKRVFEPFFTTKAVGEGTGLGLSVSYFIVTTNHGGEFLVDSRPGRGCRFQIRLPV